MKKLVLTVSILTCYFISYAQVPTISGFTPTSGPIGTTVTITGTNFDDIDANNIVYFGATRATVTAATSTQLTVTVPAGATYAPISALVNALTTVSAESFFVTFGTGVTITACSFPAETSVAVGGGSSSIAVADVNLDGNPDFLTANPGTNTVSIRLGNGLGVLLLLTWKN